MIVGCIQRNETKRNENKERIEIRFSSNLMMMMMMKIQQSVEPDNGQKT